MGQQHFISMYTDAAELERRALPLAARIKWDKSGIHRDEQPYGADMPFSQAMRLARLLIYAGDDYLAQLKELHAAGRVHIYGVNMLTGQRVRVTDVNHLDDFVEDLSPMQFQQAMLEQSLDN